METKMWRVNDMEITGVAIAFDECHKIYICEDVGDIEFMKTLDYNIYPWDALEDLYDESCPLRFIANAKLTEVYVQQGEESVRFG